MKKDSKKSFLQKFSDNREAKKQLVSILLIVVLVIAASVFIFLQIYGKYIDNILYAERLSQMSEVTSQLFKGLEDVVEKQWEDVKVQCNYLMQAKPQDTETLLQFMQEQGQIHDMDSVLTDLIAVDDQGRYYTMNGAKGTLTEMSYLLDAPGTDQFCVEHDDDPRHPDGVFKTVGNSVFDAGRKSDGFRKLLWAHP